MKYAIIGLSLFLLSFSYAQEQLGLIDCVNIAIENSLEINRAEFDVDNQEINALQSKYNQYPTLNGSTSHSLNFGRSLDFTTYTFNTEATQANSFGVSAGATLYNGGLLRENKKLQNMLLARSNTSIKALKDQIAITVAANFLAVLSAQEQINTAQNQVKLRELAVEQTQKQIDYGVVAKSTIYDVEAQLANAEFQNQQAQNNYEQSMLQLKQSMMYPFQKDFIIVTPSIDLPSIDYLRSQLNPEIVFTNATLTQASITGASEDIAIAEQSIKVSKASLYPIVSLSAGSNSFHSNQQTEVIDFETNELQLPVQGINLPGQNPYVGFVNSVPITQQTPFIDQLSNNLSQNIGINVQIPIFNGFRVRNEIKRAENNLKQSSVQSSIQLRELEQQIERAYLDAELAHNALNAADIQLRAAQKANEFTKKRTELGNVSIYDYFQTENNVANAQIQYTIAKYDFLYRVKILEFYKENNFEF